jgi:hypothetical protein
MRSSRAKKKMEHFHYNPGNMSGKDADEEASEKKNVDDKLRSRDELPERHS